MEWVDLAALKAQIAQVVKTNGNQEITGALLQQELNRIIDNLGNFYPTVYKFASYIAQESAELALLAETNNKITLNVTPIIDPVPYGFDLYETPQGNALRFIGTGLGNGDTGIFKLDCHASLQAITGASDHVHFMAFTRPYTEVDFANAIQIQGCRISHKIPNRDLIAIPIVAPYFRLNDGDLLEIVINPSDAITIEVDEFGFEIIQLLG